MKIIGFDFGTTNSTISHYIAEDNLETVRPFGAGSDYYPTVVSYEKDSQGKIIDSSSIIGPPAKENLCSKDHEVYENFKLHLGKNFNEIMKGRSKTSGEVAADFIKKSLIKYIEKQPVDIESIIITMTLPDAWYKEEEYKTARGKIKGLYKNLLINKKQSKDDKSEYINIKIILASESDAATAYFCKCYKQSEKKEFDGHVVVVDFGGGTLDVNLCKVSNGEIDVKKRDGYGKFGIKNGCAGVAFDVAVVKQLLKNKKLTIEEGNDEFIDLCHLFEKWKINSFDEYKDPMINYCIMGLPRFNKNKLGTVRGRNVDLEIYCEDLKKGFEEANINELQQSLNTIKKYLEENKINYKDQDKFRVLLVGGFSNFILVDHEVRKAFESSIEKLNDRVFLEPFGYDRYLAIAKGAAILGNKNNADGIHVIKRARFSYGFRKHYIKGKNENEILQSADGEDIKVLREGTILNEIGNGPIEWEKLKINKFVNLSKAIFCLIRHDSESDKTVVTKLPYTLDRLFPDIAHEKEYDIGFSIDEDDEIPILHIRDSKDITKKSETPLFELEEVYGM